MPAPAIAPELSTADGERFAQPVSVAGWPVVWPVARRVLKERDAAPGYPTGWPILSPAGQFSAPCYQPAFLPACQVSARRDIARRTAAKQECPHPPVHARCPTAMGAKRPDAATGCSG